MNKEEIKEQLNRMQFALESWLECSIELGNFDVPNLKAAIEKNKLAIEEIDKDKPDYEYITTIVNTNELILFRVNPIIANYN